MKNKNIIFLRIPKTAGTTIQTGFRNIADNHKKVVFSKAAVPGLVDRFSLDYFKNLDLNENINILKGHFVFSNICKNFLLFSMVREIVDLFISNLYFFYLEEYSRQNLNSENIINIKKKINFDLTLSNNDLKIIPELLKNNFINSNIITKTLAGIPFEKYFFVEEDYKLIEEDFFLAKENLKYFTYIGNTTNVQKFLNFFLQYVPVNSFEVNDKRFFKKDQKLINSIKFNLGTLIKEYNYYDTEMLKIIKNKYQ